MLEKRAAEAEFIAVYLKEELDRSTLGTNMNMSVSGTRVVQRTRSGIPVGVSPGNDEEEDMDCTRQVMRAPLGSAGEEEPGTRAVQRGPDAGNAGPPQLHGGPATKPQLGGSLMTAPQVY